MSDVALAPLPARFARLVKIEHTVFALPFAYVGAFLAVRGTPSAHDVLWVTLAMVGARSLAMALNRLIDEDFDLAVFEARYHNDETGAPAYDPAILLKIILLAYARGVTSSRSIAALCQENVVFMALSADTAPHFTTIADFVSSPEAEIVSMFRDVLLVCDGCGAATRMGARYLPNGAKERYCKKCGASNGQVSPPKARYAVKK